jgi:hypothetical protein
MITRDDLKQSKMLFRAHLDARDHFENHYANNRWPRLTCVVTNPRRRNSKVVFSKRFYVDGVEVTGCRELLARLNAPQLVAIEGGKAA